MHFNIQITVQQVLEAPPASRQPGLIATPQKGERQVIETIRVNVTAPTEAEAFAKARRLMDASEPVPEQHLHRASCDDAGGNQICGYPPGPSIASPR